MLAAFHLAGAGDELKGGGIGECGSTRFDEWGEPTLWWQFLKSKLGFEVDAPYTLNDMAADTVALMDQLQLQDAHLVGASMGGMIAQVVAAQYPSD